MLRSFLKRLVHVRIQYLWSSFSVAMLFEKVVWWIPFITNLMTRIILVEL